MSTARTGISLYKAFIATISAPLGEVGFHKKPRDIFHRVLAEQPPVLGTVGFLYTKFGADGSHEVAPIVGVRNERLEGLYASLSSEPRSRWMATTGLNIGYLMSADDYLKWPIRRDIDLEETASDIVEAIVEHALPYMEGLIEPDGLVEAVREDVGYEYKLPLALLIAGHVDEAKEIVSRELSLLGTEQHEGAESYREFASNFFRCIHDPAASDH